MKFVIAATFLLSSMAYAAKAPTFTGKATEIIKKCAEWAEKEVDKKKDAKEFEKLAHECSYKNGVDTKGK